nr:LOB domain-containing protein 12-like [Tanacetum cinerariifolium]
DIRDEEKEYPCVNKYPSFKKNLSCLWKRNHVMFTTPIMGKDKMKTKMRLVYADHGEALVTQPTSMVEKLGLNVEDHSAPYQLRWLKKGNVVKEIPVNQRADAVSSLVYEANARMRDPVYGCVGAISFLQNQVSQLQMELAMAQAEILCIQMQQEPLAPSPAALADGIVPVHPAHHSMSTDDVVSRVSSDDISYSCLNSITNHPHHNQYFNFTSNNVIQYDSLKRESSSLWT